ncbi:uncharacterized protein LOC130898026 [Diorhabda carinulata]|uniref:uncharacterized protein LOC130898026 n=1 Tax=Diorhabda carinulata TaxID=1163345 RepID=UPI0025A0D1AB|nr:uncharacterized protein LOC130898026 [Diorhabda carinulata]
MSINVHVSGNPISIKRGKMVTADLDHSKKEFEKRRLMRLEQVRQQSKHIAEDVRNKVKREKIIQMKQIEEEGKQKLKNWQNRKLLELQTQYKQALKELGTGHKEAKISEDEETLRQEQMILNQELSAKRGHKAACKLHSQMKKTESDKNAIKDRKKIVREIEDTRAAMLTGFTQPAHSEPRVKKKKHREGNDELRISIPDSDSDFQGSSNSLSDIIEGDEESTSCTCDLEDSGPSDNKIEGTKSDSMNIETLEVPTNPPMISTQNFSEKTKPKVNLPSRYTQTVPLIDSASQQHISSITEQQALSVDEPHAFKCTPCDTRISDRIKRRELFSHQQKSAMPKEQSSIAIRDYIQSRTCCINCTCGCSMKEVQLKDVDAEERTNRYKDFEKFGGTEKKSEYLDEIEDSNIHSKSDQFTKDEEIPPKPFIKVKTSSTAPPSSVPTKSSGSKVKSNKFPSKITSKSVTNPENLSTKTRSFEELIKTGSGRHHPVQMYDHPNRFGYEKSIPSSSYVEKIPIESLEVIPDPDMQEDWKEVQRKRQKDAQIRGKQALEKEKLKKDYEEMMRRLPLLQKKERVLEIFNDKPEYHMTEERLKEKERLKQNKLENAYNKAFPNLKPAFVTLPKINQAETPDTDTNHANWDVDYPVSQMFTPKEVRDILKSFTRQNPENRRTKLKELLKKLKLQKEELLKEISALPKDDNVDEIINDLRSFDTDEVEDRTKSKHKKKTPRKRCRKENETDSSIDGSSSEQYNSGNKEVVGKSPRKRAKIKQKIIILQNTSTQTTPKLSPTQDTSVQVSTTGSPFEKPSVPVQTTQTSPVFCKKIHVPCDCYKENEAPKDNMCHIFIKLKDDEEPDVVVKSTDEPLKPVELKNVRVQIPNKKSVKTQSISVDTTWKEQFSKNSTSTTSTSYLSPPDFKKKSRQDYFKKPQQKELSSIYSEYQETSGDPKIPTYVKKLLSMTRVSVENLSVSSSTVETPSQSVIEIDSNNRNPSQYVQVPLNTSCSCSDTVPEKDYSGCSTKSRENILAQYTEITDNCSKRIEALAGMIRKLREDKIKMLSTNISKSPDKDLSTTYMDLPDNKIESKESSKRSSSSLDEEEIYKKLMEINHEFDGEVKKLKESTKSARIIASEAPNDDTSINAPLDSEDVSSSNNTNQEFLDRIHRLQERPNNQNQQFEPFLSDIPRLPKFEPQENNTSSNHKRPPLSKGLTSIKKINGNVTLVPHELSTIVEADSQISTKLPSPETSRDSFNFNANQHLLPIQEVVSSTSKSNESLSKKSSGDVTKESIGTNANKSEDLPNCSKYKESCNDKTCPDGSQKMLSSSSSDDMESIENMLRSIGMEWAIPTLHKTQEALALTSSSSSLDLSRKKPKTSPIDISGSEISLREFLKKQILKISSSTMLSEESIGSFLGESSELSGIQKNTNSTRDKSRQRTSTPLGSSKFMSSSKSNVGFSDSELSSIKQEYTKSKKDEKK